jgi:hypothetical protein
MRSAYCCLLLNALLLWSCSHQKKGDGEGVKIVMPTNIEVYNPFIADIHDQYARDEHKQFKIYTLINVSCATCLLKLEKWDRFQSQNPGFSKVAIIPVCYSEDHFEQLKFVFENQKISPIRLPLVLDDSFAIRNKALVNPENFTALADAEDHVLLTGRLLGKDNDRKKFLQVIRDAQ